MERAAAGQRAFSRLVPALRRPGVHLQRRRQLEKRKSRLAQLLLGLALPRYLGGAYADWLGLRTIVERSVKWRGFGEIYRPSEKFSARAAAGKGFYQG